MSADHRIPGDKSFFRIGEVARIATVSCSKLRFWEKRFARLAPARGGTGQRRYTREDVKMILFVKDRAEEGFGVLYKALTTPGRAKSIGFLSPFEMMRTVRRDRHAANRILDCVTSTLQGNLRS